MRDNNNNVRNAIDRYNGDIFEIYHKSKRILSEKIFILMAISLAILFYEYVIIQTRYNQYINEELTWQTDNEVQIVHYILFGGTAFFAFFLFIIINNYLSFSDRKAAIKPCVILMIIAYISLLCSGIVNTMAKYNLCLFFFLTCIYTNIPILLDIAIFSVAEDLRDEATFICYVFINLMQTIADTEFFEILTKAFNSIKVSYNIVINIFAVNVVLVCVAFYFIYRGRTNEELSESDSESDEDVDLIMVEDAQRQ